MHVSCCRVTTRPCNTLHKHGKHANFASLTKREVAIDQIKQNDQEVDDTYVQPICDCSNFLMHLMVLSRCHKGPHEPVKASGRNMIHASFDEQHGMLQSMGYRASVDLCAPLDWYH